MDMETIKEIEAEFGISLPEEYNRLLLANPLGDRLKYPNVYDFFLGEKEDLLAINRLVRKKGYAGKPWPNEFFIIGFLGDVTYFIDTRETKSAVYLVIKGQRALNPRNMERMKQADSIGAHVEWMVKMQGVHHT